MLCVLHCFIPNNLQSMGPGLAGGPAARGVRTRARPPRPRRVAPDREPGRENWAPLFAAGVVRDGRARLGAFGRRRVRPRPAPLRGTTRARRGRARERGLARPHPRGGGHGVGRGTRRGRVHRRGGQDRRASRKFSNLRHEPNRRRRRVYSTRLVVRRDAGGANDATGRRPRERARRTWVLASRYSRRSRVRARRPSQRFSPRRSRY